MEHLYLKFLETVKVLISIDNMLTSGPRPRAREASSRWLRTSNKTIAGEEVGLCYN